MLVIFKILKTHINPVNSHELYTSVASFTHIHPPNIFLKPILFIIVYIFGI